MSYGLTIKHEHQSFLQRLDEKNIDYTIWNAEDFAVQKKVDYDIEFESKEDRDTASALYQTYKSIYVGIQQSGRREVVDLGSFAKYAKP
jgi:hypothetical protein